jgi:hypothetical protein
MTAPLHRLLVKRLSSGHPKKLLLFRGPLKFSALGSMVAALWYGSHIVGLRDDNVETSLPGTPPVVQEHTENIKGMGIPPSLEAAVQSIRTDDTTYTSLNVRSYNYLHSSSLVLSYAVACSCLLSSSAQILNSCDNKLEKSGSCAERWLAVGQQL